MKCFPQNCERYSFFFFPSAGLLGSSYRPSLLFPSCGCGMKHLAELELGYSFLLSRCLYYVDTAFGGMGVLNEWLSFAWL